MKATLKLVHDADAVQPVREASTFDQGWDARQGMMKKRGDGKDKTRKLWEKASKKVGSTKLLESLKRYLREEKEPTCGYPGLSVWLNGERYDHWLALPDTAIGPESRTKAPELIRSICLERLGDAFVRSYLDPCTFHEDGYITPATGFAMKKLMEKASELKAAGVMGIRSKNA